MKLKKFIALFLILIMAVVAASCGGAADVDNVASGSRTFVDSCGREVEIPLEIDSIAPSGPLAQIVLFTACPDRLAGIAADFPDEAKQIIDEKYWNMTKFGQFYGKNASLNMEALIDAAPDVIVDIGEAKDTVVEDMNGLQEQLDIPVVFIEATLDTMDEAYAKIGELIDDTKDTDKLAEYCKNVSEKADSINTALTDQERVSVYEAFDESGLNTNARGSFQGEVIDKVGGVNVADVEIVSAGSGSEVSLEQVVNWNPDVILVEEPDVYQMVTTDKAWSELDAVKTGRVYIIPDIPYSCMGNPPSVNRVMGILWLGDILYPGQYGTDIKEEFREFYKLFYHVELMDEEIAEILGE
jgi:iron complex transport system substrate-binding protein